MLKNSVLTCLAGAATRIVWSNKIKLLRVRSLVGNDEEIGFCRVSGVGTRQEDHA